MLDIVLVAVPFSVIEVPPLALAVLKGAVESEGLTSKTIDLGMELFKEVDKNNTHFDRLQQYFAKGISSNNADESADAFLEQWANRLIEFNSRWIGLSVFSYNSQLAAYLLCTKLKKINPNINIVIGGTGAATNLSSDIYTHCNATSSEKLIKYGDFLKKRQLITECIYGDGEQALVDLLQGNLEYKEFHTENYKAKPLPFSNFDDYNLLDYKGQLGKGYPQLPIFSSKGCVRSCDFCDVESTVQKFRFRTGENIAKEMIFLSNKYGIYDFVFLDSLVNGSIKNLKEWMTELAIYNKAHPDKKITWTASGWICRPAGQMPESMYTLMKESGCTSVTIGAESGSNRVLKAMDKKTTVEALYYEAEQLRKHDINFITLLIVGHWSEQWEDFLDTCELMLNLSKYARYGNYTATNPGLGFEFIPHIPAGDNVDTNKLVKANPKLWWTSINPGLTLKERTFRVLLLERLINELHIPLMYEIAEILYNKMSADVDETIDYYEQVTKDVDIASYQFAEHYYKNFDKFWQLLVNRNSRIKKKVSVKLDLEAQSVDANSLPKFEIHWNKSLVYTKYFPDGNHVVDLELECSDLNELELKFSNKQINDTLVGTDGNIVKDKFIKINKFIVDDNDLVTDPEFFYKVLRYTENSIKTTVKDGFWTNNSRLTLSFDFPFIKWYSENSTKNSKFSVYIMETNTPIRSEDVQIDYNEYRAKLVKLLESMKH